MIDRLFVFVLVEQISFQRLARFSVLSRTWNNGRNDSRRCMTPLKAIRGIRRGHRQPLSKGRNFEAPPAGEPDRSAGPV